MVITADFRSADEGSIPFALTLLAVRPGKHQFGDVGYWLAHEVVTLEEEVRIFSFP